MRIGMIHQPHFLPWPGYMARCLAVDVFIALDNVKFNRNHYQQRTKFFDRVAKIRWLSLPINGATRSGLISDVKIAEDFSIKKWQRVVVESYRRFPQFHRHWGEVTQTISENYPSFCNVSLGLIEWLLLDLSNAISHPLTEIVRASEIEMRHGRTNRLIDICRDRKVTHLVMGAYALESHDVTLLTTAGINLLNQKFVGPDSSFPTPGIMALHYVFRDGIEQTAKDLVSHWSLVPDSPLPHSAS